jgi:hypothetical protein
MHQHLDQAGTGWQPTFADCLHSFLIHPGKASMGSKNKQWRWKPGPHIHELLFGVIIRV